MTKHLIWFALGLALAYCASCSGPQTYRNNPKVADVVMWSLMYEQYEKSNPIQTVTQTEDAIEIRDMQ